MRPRLRLGFALSALAAVLLLHLPAAAMMPGDGGGGLQQCDFYLNIHWDGYGNIINTWVSMENCTVLQEDVSGGGGGGDINTRTNGIRWDTDCSDEAQRNGYTAECCQCFKNASLKGRECLKLARWIPGPAKIAMIEECARQMTEAATDCVAGGPCA